MFRGQGDCGWGREARPDFGRGGAGDPPPGPARPLWRTTRPGEEEGRAGAEGTGALPRDAGIWPLRGRRIRRGKQPLTPYEQPRPWAAQTWPGTPLAEPLKARCTRTRLGGTCGASGVQGSALGGRRAEAPRARGRAAARRLQGACAGCPRALASRPRGAGPGPGDASAGLGLIVIG